jgi:cell division protein FtsQ
MEKSERKRTMVYSNVNKKKADSKSAFRKNDLSDLENEVFIGVKSFPKPNQSNKKKNKSGRAVDNKKKKASKRENKKDESKNDTNKNYATKNDSTGKDTNKVDKIKSIFRKNKSDNDLSDNEIEDIKEKVIIEDEQDVNRKKLKTIIVNTNVKKPKLTKEQKIKLQKRMIIKRLSIMLSLIFLLIGGIVYFILSPVFNVKAIEVVDNTRLSSEQIVSMSEISLNANTFKFSSREVKNKLLKNPYIEDIKVNRGIFSNSVKITVKERIATLMLEYGNSYVYINNQGYILEISPIKLESPIVKGYVTPLEDIKPGNRLNKDDLERLEVVLKIIESVQSAGIENLITQIDISNKKNYVLTIESEDKTVYLGTCSDLSTQMLYIKEMLQREKGIEGEFFVDMDLNTGNPVFREKV